MNMILKTIYNLLGAICIGNGIWMLLAASNWFMNMPIAAQDTGPLNTHFVHDIGWVFVLVGMGAFWCSHRLYKCTEIHLGITLFIAGHASIHMVEILLGLLPQSHWLIDFPLVTFPALLLVGITPVILKINTPSYEK